ncbi:MAG: hypothetical protein JO063_14925 [Pseudonocardiales bacterium]|nr:hypothetical protein [Pseudonocardiales bacterium]MBV9031747.1 hypothetical protein [Pseudonocardiales bacterium]MBW0011378.1 hypothetical protein [Pseudonocardiales bacterium]
MFANYAMAGLYEGHRDCDRHTGERGGVEYGSPGDTAMREDLGGVTNALAETHPHTSLVHVGAWTAEEAVRAAQDAWTGGYYLDVPTSITIDE